MSADFKVVGIVGGMGPKAGIELLNRITAYTPAATDQGHLSTILMSFPGQIVDRSAYLGGVTAENPAYSIAQIIRKLESAGAEVVGVACNTSHSPKIYNVIVNLLEQANCRVQLVHMPYETCLQVKRAYPYASRVGLMLTNGTYRSGLYQNMLRGLGYQVVLTDRVFQQEVIHRMVYDPVFGIKANPDRISGEVLALRRKAFDLFKEERTDVIILGCTELSLLMDQGDLDIPVVDSTDVLARALIREATNTANQCLHLNESRSS